jgi:chromosome segregation ATPase
VILYMISVIGSLSHEDSNQEHHDTPVVEYQAVAPKAPLEVKHEPVKASPSSAELELAALKAQVNQLNQALLNKDSQLAEVQGHLSKKEVTLLQTQSQIQKYKSDYEASKVVLDQSKAKLNSALASLQELENSLTQQITQKKTVEQELQMTKAQRDHTLKEAEDLRSSLVSVREDLQVSDSKMGLIRNLLQAEENLSAQ